MKTFLLFLLIVIYNSTLGNPLEDSIINKKRSKNFYGFSVGLSKTVLDGTEVDLHLNDPGAYQDSKLGLDIAFTFKHQFSSFLYFKSGAELTNKRSYMRNNGFHYPLEAKLRFISIPILVGVQPINLKNSNFMNLSIESGLSCNIDFGSSDNIGAGLLPDIEVRRELIVPAFIIGGTLEAKANERFLAFLSYKHSKDLINYFERSNNYYYQVTSDHIAIGILFFPKNN